MDTSLKGALKKAKRKQLFKTAIIAALTMLILFLVFYRAGNYFAAKSSQKLHDALFLHNEIAEPNIHIDSQVIANGTMFGGNIVTNRSKNINGYMVEWSTLTSSYNWFQANIDYNELVPGFYWSDNEFYEYDKQTKKKVATFYHPGIKKYHDGVQNELREISQMEEHIAEVAVSFDRPYTWNEIKAKIPGNLNTVWLYMTSPIADESKGPAGMPIYGFDPANSPSDGYESFLDALKKYDPSKSEESIQAFLKENEKKPFDEVEILGVMLTGKAENFKALEDQEFVRGASVGATAPIVPYIQPDK